MNYLDLILGGLLLYGGVKGFFKGLIIEAASLLALVMGLVGALLFSASVGDYIQTHTSITTVPPSGVVFLIVFIVIIIAINVLARILTRVMRMAALGSINRFFGALFGMTKFALFISALLLLVDQFAFLFQYFDTHIIEESYLYEPIKQLGSLIFGWLLDKKELFPEGVL